MAKCRFHRWHQLSPCRQKCRACGKVRNKRATAKRRKPIKRVSKPKAAWLAKYRKAIASDKALGNLVCANCCRALPASALDPHHPCGRRGSHLMFYFWVCKSLHRKIHARGQLARIMGWLQPEYDGAKECAVNAPFLFNNHRRAAAEAGFVCD